LSMTRFEKVATPVELVEAVVVPEANVNPCAVSVTLALGTGLPKASSTVAWTAGLIDVPAVVLVGCWVKLTVDAAAAVIAKALLVAPEVPVTAAEIV
jgi:hypothetical protein